MKESAQILKESGIRVTPQRLGVYKILKQEEKHKHLTADEIHEKINRKLPGVSLATIYTVLELFKENRLIQEIRIKVDKSCFEVGTSEHHHFLCNECGRILDINIDPCPHLQKKEVDGNLIAEHHGYFYGTCKNCRGLK